MNTKVRLTEAAIDQESTGRARTGRSLQLVANHAAVEPSRRPHPVADRVFDLVLASMLAIVFLPIIVISTIVLALSPGPVFFSQTRLGKGGRPFQVHKFRTMVADAPEVLARLLETHPELRAEWERDYKLKDDPRITPIGRFLRKTSLDELPQLWNIIKGDMSIVGPRPIASAEIEKYGRFAKHYFAQRPGLTGLWQVSGRSDASYERRVVLDAFYSKNRSIIMDLSIVAKTVGVVLRGSGAY